MISSRHIRHDWKTWVDWEQQSVRTVCGVTTRRGLAGIPGITEQAQVVITKDKRLWGWCWPCVKETYEEMAGVIGEEAFQELHLDENVQSLYKKGMSEIIHQYVKSNPKFSRHRRRDTDVVE